MNSSALIVQVADTERAERREYVFARSPIRVGRSQLNELPLEHAFVSHCHGLFVFDHERVSFIDIGSTNGSFLNGRRLDKNQRVTLSDSAAIQIGALRLDARLERRASSDTRASYAFGSFRAPQSEPAIGHARARSRAASGALEAYSAQSSPSEPEQRSALLNQRFAQSFLELRRGQHQLLSELGLPLPGADKLQTIDDTGELLVYLLDPTVSHDRVDELSRAYADLMMHEVALVSAIGAGCRELLDELSPANLAPEGLGGVAGWVARLFGHDARWRLLESKTDELQEQAALTSLVLGRGFARAYVAALGKGSDSGPCAAGAPPKKGRR